MILISQSPKIKYGDDEKITKTKEIINLKIDYFVVFLVDGLFSLYLYLRIVPQNAAKATI